MVIAAILGYLLGSIPVAQLVGRVVGVDPLRQGDRNPGWWNMRGLAGEKVAAFVAVGDVAKGMAAAVVGNALWGPWWVTYVAVFFAMVGHAFPLFARFEGGRSILTWAGAMSVISPIAVVLALVLGAVPAAVARRVAVFALIATFSFPFFQALFDPRAHVATTGVLMTFIGLRFLFARPANQTPAPGAV